MIKKDFTVDEIFRLAIPSGKISSKQLIKGNDIPYVGSKKTNNGIQKMCSIDNIPREQITNGNCIVFIQRGNGSAGYTTYQPNDFYATSNVCCGYIDGIMNENIGIYLSAILDKNKKLYGHGTPWTGNRLKDTILSLPVKTDEDGEPIIENGNYVVDWEYIDAYIDEIKQGAYQKIAYRLSTLKAQYNDI